MRKKFNLKSTILGITIGGIVFGSIGVVATNYLLKAEDVEYRDNKNLQDAIDELYGMANSNSSHVDVENLPVGTPIVEGFKITIPYTGTYSTIYCVYGNDDNYGSIGTLENNTCVFGGTTSITHHYKLMATDNNGKIYEYHSTVTMGSGLPLSVVNLGDYIYLTPQSSSTIVTNGVKASSGCSSSTATVNFNDLTVWRVIRKNSDGTVDVVSDKSTPAINFCGTLTTVSLSIGDYGSTASSSISFNTSNPSSLVSGTDLYDINQALSGLGTSNNVNYCIGGGSANPGTYGGGDLYAYIVSNSGVSRSTYKIYSTPDYYSYGSSYSCGFRLKTKLISNVKIISGTGSSDSPYQLGL